MSRGLGRVERAVLAYLEERARREPLWPISLDLLAYETGHHPESIRRAGKTLQRKGLVEIGWDNGWREQFGKLYDTACPTYLLSAEHSSTLSPPAESAS